MHQLIKKRLENKVNLHHDQERNELLSHRLLVWRDREL